MMPHFGTPMDGLNCEVPQYICISDTSTLETKVTQELKYLSMNKHVSLIFLHILLWPLYHYYIYECKINSQLYKS